MVSKFLTITFAAVTAAAPATVKRDSCEFSLTMGYGNDALKIVAIESGDPEYVNLVGMDQEEHGTPVTSKGDGPNGHAKLSLNIEAGELGNTEDSKYGIFVPDLGELYGTQVPVTAYKGEIGTDFFIEDDHRGYVDARRTAASQNWYSCPITVQGQEYTGLSWGVYNSNGSSPYGCSITRVDAHPDIPNAE